MSTKLQRYKLSSLIDVKRGQSISGEYYASEGEHVRLTLANFDYVNGGFKVDTQKDDLFYTGPVKPECLLKKDDIITPLTEQALGLLGSTARIPESDKYVQSGDIALVTCKEDLIDTNFCYYLLPSKQVKKQLAAGSQQTKIRHTSPDAIKACIVDIPEYEQQKKIGDFLSLLDRKISLNRAINKNLEALAKQIYDYWFVQFDFPNENGRPYKSSGGKMVWNKDLNRKIPSQFRLEQIGQHTQVLLGGTPDTQNANYWDGTYPWINSGEVAEFPIISSEKNITEEGLNSSATVYAPKGSVTLSITRHLRPSILAIDACINQSVVAIKETEEIRKEYLYPFIKRDIPRLMTLRTGAQQPHINKETVDKTWLIIPDKKSLSKYYDITKPIYENIINNAFEMASLTKQRDELLPLLMNGQVTIN